MTPTPKTADIHEDDVTPLHPYLQERLSKYFGKQRAIRRLDRRLCPYTSSFRIDELDVRFNDGSRVQLILKDLSRVGMVDEARRARLEFLYDPQREISAYQFILPHAPTGTARWYGGVFQAPAERYWLLLEQVDGLPLWQVGDVSIWEQTAAWIARFHHAFSPLEAEQLATRAGVLAYDEDFYWRWLSRAQRFANGDAGKRRVLDGVERGYPRLVERLMSLPQTLIHGEFYASNVIVKEERVCPLDWEMTAIGPALIDLAALTAGWAKSTQRALARAYVGAGNGNGTAPAARRSASLSRDFMVDLDCCRLHLAVRMLGWSDDWAPPRDHAHNWLAEAERISRRLES